MSSRGFSNVLRGTITAPTRMIAVAITTQSTQFSMTRAMREDFVAAPATRSLATARDRSSSSRYVTRSSSQTIISRSASALARARTRPGTVNGSDIETSSHRAQVHLAARQGRQLVDDDLAQCLVLRQRLLAVDGQLVL